MKYQIYLKKDVSELINAVAKATGKKPTTFIKDFLESCFNEANNALGQEATDKVREYGKK